jgi:hypothetical protein
VTLEEIAAPLMPALVPLAYALAVVAVLLLVRHIAQRYPSVPARLPLNIRIDGRPSKRSGPKAILWVDPAILAAVLALLGVLLAVKPPPPPELRVPFALGLVVFAEVAWFVGWLDDRKIELARKMTYRIMPMRTLRAFLPILATIAVVIALIART